MPDTIDREMFYGAKPDIFAKAQMLRENMTPAELQVWNRINKSKIMGLRFKPQHPIDIFIADFYCHKLKLVIEIDGEVHQNSERAEYDIGRTAELERFEIKVIRFLNKQVEEDINGVIRSIVNECLIRKRELEL
ncbi:MAG: endonuclease domain-containing protein [Prolixibacteraceae bacterium]